VEIRALIGPAHHHDHEILVPDQGVADGRLEEVAMLLDPALQIEGRKFPHDNLLGNDQFRMTNDERMSNAECPMTAKDFLILTIVDYQCPILKAWGILNIRHLTFDIVCS
jgi:hypothetical protein